MDMAAMLTKDYGYDVQDDYHNLDLLKGKGIVDGTICDKMKKLNGVRNIIVHRYNEIEKELIVSNLDAIKGTLLMFVAGVEDAHKKSI